MEKAEVIRDFKENLEKTVIRYFIKKSYPGYKASETYIIYDGNQIEVFNESTFNLKRAMKNFESYLISKPLKIT